MEKKSGGIGEKHRNRKTENTEITDFGPANSRKILDASTRALNSSIDGSSFHSEEFSLVHNRGSNSMLPVAEESQLNRAKIALQENSGKISSYKMRSREKFNKLVI